MNPAIWPRGQPLRERLLVVDPRRRTIHGAHLADLPSVLRPGDVLVVNDAATLPASLRARGPDGEVVEIRLIAAEGNGLWTALLLGSGSWKRRTEDRPSPPRYVLGTALQLDGMEARVEASSPVSPRLVKLAFDRSGESFWSALYRAGRPIQYSYLAGPLRLWHVQSTYASRPWAVEQPSAGRPLNGELLLALLSRGIELASVTHATGISSTGDPELDALLPLPERFEIPPETVERIALARGRGGRVIAVGTSAARALEGNAAQNGGTLGAGAGITELKIGPDTQLRVAEGILTGFHERSGTHFSLLQAFAPRELLDAAYTHAETEGYLNHEFGDSTLIVPE
jgi:S-adenosylmethionine:tRNA ribosyltransferase-isomerase